MTNEFIELLPVAALSCPHSDPPPRAPRTHTMGEAAAHAWRPHRQQPSMLPCLRQAADGSVLPSELAGLEQQELAAVAVKDYTLAAQLYATRMALTPRPLLQPADCAPATVEGQRDFFLQHGVRLALPTDPLPYRHTPSPPH